jgi:hypothetical protein
MMKHRKILAASAAMLVAGGLVVTSGPVGAAATPTAPAQARIADPDRNLGAGWQTSADVAITGVGDTDGFHVEIAREKDAFRWSTLATLSGVNPNGGPWMGYTCLTGSGRYVVAVYLPLSESNRQQALQAGAIAAVVDTGTGASRQIASDVALSYFSPACGAGDTVLLSRSIGRDEEQTDLLRVDAATARVTSTVRVGRQVTNMVPGPDGDYGIVGGKLVGIGGSGKLAQVADPAGQTFAAVATGQGVDLLVRRGERAFAQRFTGGKMIPLGDAPLHELDLFPLSGGRSALVGTVSAIDTTAAPGLLTLPSDRPASALSAQGHLVVNRMASVQTKEVVTAGISAPQAALARHLEVGVRTVHSGAVTDGQITTTPAPRLIAGADSTTAVNYTDPTCAVERNDLRAQVLQPTAEMVEWAVDRAVKGTLTTSRPADYLRSGLPAYSPQGLFGAPTLNGGGQIPAQVYLAILAQESNFRQATWHARPGDGGNPLIGDYYGKSPAVDDIDYAGADCGYGIGQVTDGMRKTSTTYTATQKKAIAIDYAANIAAGLRILADKWNQIRDAGLKLNGGDPRYVENWFFATWAYNSGFYPPAPQWGVGWFNNPANPRYKANRNLFLRDTYDDAAHAGQWGYPEKILGWAETPQLTYFGERSYNRVTSPFLGRTVNPDLNTFCQPNVNNCTPGVGCPAENSTCWYRVSVNWAENNCVLCAQEDLEFDSGDPEPAMTAQYPSACDRPPATIIVDDIPDSSLNVRGCAGEDRQGKFTLRTGGNAGLSAYVAQIDLHSFGAGYKGHMWFTHSYSDAPGPPDGLDFANRKFQVTGTWTPDLAAIGGAGDFRIQAHMPTHGVSEGQTVTYRVYPGPDQTGKPYPAESFEIEQKPINGWIVITPSILLHPGARVVLSNLHSGGDGSKNVMFDALSFTRL